MLSGILTDHDRHSCRLFAVFHFSCFALLSTCVEVGKFDYVLKSVNDLRTMFRKMAPSKKNTKQFVIFVPNACLPRVHVSHPIPFRIQRPIIEIIMIIQKKKPNIIARWRKKLSSQIILSSCHQSLTKPPLQPQRVARAALAALPSALRNTASLLARSLRLARALPSQTKRVARDGNARSTGAHGVFQIITIACHALAPVSRHVRDAARGEASVNRIQSHTPKPSRRLTCYQSPLRSHSHCFPHHSPVQHHNSPRSLRRLAPCG